MFKAALLQKNKAFGLVLSLLFTAWAPSNALADSYVYSFTLSPIDENISTASGTFSLNSNAYGSDSFTGTPIYITYSTGGDLFAGQAVGYIQFAMYPSGLSGLFQYQALNGGSMEFGGPVTISQNEIQGTVNVRQDGYVTDAYGSAFFDAILSSPASGGGSSSGAGGAPTPEVNAGLGMFLAGATFVFLRRKRGSRHDRAAA